MQLVVVAAFRPDVYVRDERALRTVLRVRGVGLVLGRDQVSLFRVAVAFAQPPLVELVQVEHVLILCFEFCRRERRDVHRIGIVCDAWRLQVFDRDDGSIVLATGRATGAQCSA
eukprot:4413775-Pleurochrysis_carterae.AAC.1